jgi:hypothetical protein
MTMSDPTTTFVVIFLFALALIAFWRLVLVIILALFAAFVIYVITMAVELLHGSSVIVIALGAAGLPL